MMHDMSKRKPKRTGLASMKNHIEDKFGYCKLGILWRIVRDEHW
jgi:hypothetical protein